VLSKIKAGGGKVILSSADVAKLGAPTFDALIVNKGWAENNRDFVTALVRELARADAYYRANRAAFTNDSAQVRAIARIVGAAPADVPAALASYGFPNAEEQASRTWLGGGKDSGAAKALASTAVFLKEQGRITEVPEDFSRFVDPNYAAAAR
jgi:taurine transport system substrate-binding protein